MPKTPSPTPPADDLDAMLARALGKPLRYSFGRADREYKDRWCNRVPVYQV